MSMINSIIGKVKLLTDIKGMPDGGLTVSNIRVELFQESTPDSAWIAEISVLGELPWYEGEDRKVKIRIMTDEFRMYVEKNRPNLFIRHGSQVIGVLVLEPK